MGFAPVIGAAVSVIGGISSASAQSKSQAAQQQQIQAQAENQKAQTEANKNLLDIQAAQNQKQYENSVLSRLAAYTDQAASIRATKLLAQAQNQAQQYSIQSGNLQNQIKLNDQQFQTEAALTGSQIAASQADQKSSARQSEVSNALNDAAFQTAAGMSEAQRAAMSQAAMHGGNFTASDEAKLSHNLMDTVSQALSQTYGIDRAAALSEMQGLNEADMNSIARQLGVYTHDVQSEAIQKNQQLSDLGAQLASGVSQSNFDLTSSAADIAKRQLDLSRDLTEQSSYDAYLGTQDSLAQQQKLNEKTGTISQAGFSDAQQNASGGGFLDYLNMGAKTFGSISSLLNQTPTVQTSSYNFTNGTIPSSSFYSNTSPSTGDFNSSSSNFNFFGN